MSGDGAESPPCDIGFSPWRAAPRESGFDLAEFSRRALAITRGRLAGRD
jgi:hypothetical protein